MFRLFRKKQKPEKKPTPSWMTWIAVAIVAYSLITNGINKLSNPPTTAKQEETAKDKNDKKNGGEEQNKKSELPSLGSLLNPEKFINLDVLKDRVFPQATIRLQVKDIKKGDGTIAICGQKTTIKYKSSTEDGKEIESEKKLSLQIGEGKAMPALERGVLGMEKNGKRIILSPNYLAYGAENFTRNDVPALANINFEVEMLDISPPIPEHSAYRIIGEALGFSSVYTCGTQAKLQLSIWDTEGKKLYDTKDKKAEPISFTLGKSEVFLGLEQGILGMAATENRILVVPPSMQKTMHGNKPTIDFPLPKNQTILVYVDAIP